MIKAMTLTVLFFCMLHSPPAISQADPPLEAALNRLKPAAQLDITLRNGDRYLGKFTGRENDQLLVSGNFTADQVLSTRSLSLEDIVRLRLETSGAGRGFGVGFTTGAVVGGSLSLLLGLALSQQDYDDDSTAMGIVGITLAGASVSGVGLGVVGAGIGTLATVWTTVYEAEDAPQPTRKQPTQDSRLALGVGWVSGNQDGLDQHHEGLFGTAGLNKPLGSVVGLGPELAYYDLDGIVEHRTGDNTYYDSLSSMLSMGLAVSVQPRKAGWAPYAVGGLALYLGNGEFPGMSLGGGLRFRSAGRQELRLELRDHFSLLKSHESRPLSNFITLGANFSFGL